MNPRAEMLWDWRGETRRRLKGLFFPWGLSGSAAGRLGRMRLLMGLPGESGVSQPRCSWQPPRFPTPQPGAPACCLSARRLPAAESPSLLSQKIRAVYDSNPAKFKTLQNILEAEKEMHGSAWPKTGATLALMWLKR